MDCKQCADELTAYLDGELNTTDSDRVKAHLKTCIPCFEEMRSLEDIGNFVETHNRVLEPPPRAWNMVRARIYQEAPEPVSRGWLARRWRFALAAFVLLAAFVIGYEQYLHVQKSNLDRYISQYVRERESPGIQSQVSNPDGYNPFIEVKAAASENPFRSED